MIQIPLDLLTLEIEPLYGSNEFALDLVTYLFIILPPDVGPAQYRLKFIYALDKYDSNDTQTKKLREGRSSEPETVILDIPWGSIA